MSNAERHKNKRFDCDILYYLGSMDAIKLVLGGLGKTCKSCHNEYRVEKK